ncbi:MAG: HlyD family efflux transporter periplasmic adaptor subunit [Bacteroidota bacterium]
MAEEFEDNVRIYSEEVKDILSDPPKSIFRWGNTILLFFFSIIFFLAWVIKYPDIVAGQAVLTTLNPPQKEYSRVMGKIDSIFVTNQSQVTENTHLALIENSANYKDVMVLKSFINKIEISENEVSFDLDELPMLFLGEIESHFSLFENSYIQYILNKNSNSFKSNDLNFSQQLSQLKFRLKSLKDQKEINAQELTFRKSNLERMESLLESGAISAQEYEQTKLDYLRAEREFKNMNNSISQLEENINNTSNIRNQSEIENNRVEISLLKSVIQSLDELKEAINAWEQRFLFTSKINGKVSFMNVWNKNQAINLGDLVFTIIPDDYLNYICKVQVPASNSGKIEIGQRVNIRLSSYPSSEFGIIIGKIKEISLIPNNEGMYLLDVSIPNELVTTFDKKIEFKQEMPGMAEIVTEDLRLIERIFYQLNQILRQQ